jgi:2-polyprenyl-3-methyl-5-hydroxy-6-metoxy-1,4-benzoquinol methylase
LLETTTNAGLHDFLVAKVIPRFIRSGMRAVDLGAGPGALAARLHSLGLDVTAADINPDSYQAAMPFVQADFNQPDFAARLGPGSFSLVTSVEVIEHVESPIGFLRGIGRLLADDGTAILTTPNVDSAPARLKFLVRGKIRMMDEIGEPTHISPIFWDLFRRQFLPRAGLALVEHGLFPSDGYQLTRKRYAWAFRLLAAVLPGESVLGDNHILVLKKDVANNAKTPQGS